MLQRKSLDELNERIIFSAEEILPFSAITKMHVDSGLTLSEICEASIRISDNTAANLVIEELGGIDEFRESLREIGDNVTEPARLEFELNIFTPDSIDDTSTPRQFAKDLELYLLSDLLSEEKKSLLANCISDNSVTDNSVTDNLIKKRRKKPIVVAIMTRRNEENERHNNALIRDITKMIFNSP